HRQAERGHDPFIGEHGDERCAQNFGRRLQEGRIGEQPAVEFERGDERDDDDETRPTHLRCIGYAVAVPLALSKPQRHASPPPAGARFSKRLTSRLSVIAVRTTTAIQAYMRAGSISSAASAMLRPMPATDDSVSPPRTDAKQMKN